MPVIAKQNGAKLVIINRDETPCDPIADCVVHSQASQTIAAVIKELYHFLMSQFLYLDICVKIRIDSCLILFSITGGLLLVTGGTIFIAHLF
jgi:hypothetical protein